MPSSPGPVWTVVLMEGTDSSPTLQLVDELSLVTTLVSIEVVQVPATFDTADLSEKLRLIREVSPAAAAAIWLDGAATYRLAVVEDVAAPGPPSVHYIEADALPSVALLTRDFLIGRGAVSEAEALPDDAQNPVPKSQAADAETPWDEPAEAPRTPSPTLLGVGLLGEGGSGLQGGKSAGDWFAGGGITVHVAPWKILALRWTITGGSGASRTTEEVVIHQHWGAAALSLFLRSKVGTHLFIGGYLSAGVVLNRVRLEHEDTGMAPVTANKWTPEVGAGVHLAVPVGARVRVGLDAGGYGRLLKYHYNNARTGEELFASTTWVWKASAWAVVFLPFEKKP